jgi:chemotaxis methyl-accepting protein methylase
MPQHEDTGMAFVLVQHLSPDHKSVLVELLKRHTRMPVFEAADGMVVRPDCAYIIPPSHDLQLVGGALRLKRHDEQRRPRLTIDHFFTSLAAQQHERAICIVMSGTGSDGTAGLREIKGEGGLAIAQSPESAEYDGMPSSAIATGMVDYVLAPPQMPAQLMSYVRHAFVAQRQPAASAEHRDSVLKRLCLLLRAQTGHDFTQYKETTLVRRLERRMALHQVAQADDYLRYARDNPKEVEALFRDLLIGVTHFFRDPDVFKLLEEKVLPTLLSRKASGEPLRVWVCGCSTGEEAYTLAMLLYERMLASKLVPKVNLFATDIDHFAIEHARAGIYPASIAAHVSEERLNRFFTHDAQRGTYRIQKHVRDMMVFSEQDVIKDPPFSKLDLISCRNLLIYLNADLQRKLIPLFHYALVPGGALLLGTSESVGESAHLFQVVDRKCKLYYRLPGDMTLPHPALPDFVPPLTDRHGRRPLRVPAGGRQGKHAAADHRAGAAGALRARRPADRRSRADPAHRRAHRPIPRARRRRRGDEHPGDGARGAAPRAVGRAAQGGRAPGAGDLPGPARQGQRRAHQRQPGGAAARRCGRDGAVPGGARGAAAATIARRAAAARRRPSGPPGRARERVARQGRLPADHAGGDGDHQRGAEVHQRGAAVGQRRDAIDQRGAGDLQGGAAIGQRGAVHRQRRAAGQGQRPLARQQRHEQPAGRHRHRHGVRRPSRAHLALHAGRDPGDQPDHQ